MFSFFPFSYPGGFKQVTAAQLHHKDPTAVISTDHYIFLFKTRNNFRNLEVPTNFWHVFHSAFLDIILD